jgi:hypothetical protein
MAAPAPDEPTAAEDQAPLGVDAVMARYGLGDRRAARRVMDAAGSFKVAGRLYVATDDLVAYEARLKAERAERTGRPTPPVASRQTPRPASPDARPVLAPGWWREPS